MNFVNLHLHTDYSLNDAPLSIKELAGKLREYGQDTCAITDHGFLTGHYEFFDTMSAHSIKPVLGVEFYTFQDKNMLEKGKRNHLVCFARNDEGLLNLRKIQYDSLNHIYKGKPFVFESELEGEGLIATSACIQGHLHDLLVRDDINSAMKYVDLMHNRFDDFYLELQFHPSLLAQGKYNSKLIDFAQSLGYRSKLIITFDTHFLTRREAIVRDYLLAGGWKKSIEELYESGYKSLESCCLGSEELVYQFAHESGVTDKKLLDSCINNTRKLARRIENYGVMVDAVSDVKVPFFDKQKQLEEFFSDLNE